MEDKKYKYMLLDRLKSDCEYFLGNGNRCEKHLWAGSVKEQINKMRELYNSFSNSDKPEWLSEKDIDNYENDMSKIVTPCQKLGKGWYWHKYNDNSGYLKSPDGRTYMSYDLNTNEYKVKETDNSYNFFPLSYYYADGIEPSKFKPFDFMEQEMIENILPREDKITDREYDYENIDVKEISKEYFNILIEKLDKNIEFTADEKLKFLLVDEDIYIAVDNTDGSLWVEEFKDKKSAIKYLYGEFEENEVEEEL